MISDTEKQEWMAFAQSETFRKDMQHLALNRHNPFMADGKVDIDRYIEFLNAYNEFINHARKPQKPFIENNMKL